MPAVDNFDFTNGDRTEHGRHVVRLLDSSRLLAVGVRPEHVVGDDRPLEADDVGQQPVLGNPGYKRHCQLFGSKPSAQPHQQAGVRDTDHDRVPVRPVSNVIYMVVTR